MSRRGEAVCSSKGIRVQPSNNSTRYRFVMRVPDPMAAKVHFAKAGVETINPLETWELIHRQVGLDPVGFPDSEAAASSTLSLPVWPGMTKGDEDQVMRALERLEIAA